MTWHLTSPAGTWYRCHITRRDVLRGEWCRRRNIVLAVVDLGEILVRALFENLFDVDGIVTKTATLGFGELRTVDERTLTFSIKQRQRRVNTRRIERFVKRGVMQSVMERRIDFGRIGQKRLSVGKPKTVIKKLLCARFVGVVKLALLDTSTWGSTVRVRT